MWVNVDSERLLIANTKSTNKFISSLKRSHNIKSRVNKKQCYFKNTIWMWTNKCIWDFVITTFRNKKKSSQIKTTTKIRKKCAVVVRGKQLRIITLFTIALINRETKKQKNTEKLLWQIRVACLSRFLSRLSCSSMRLLLFENFLKFALLTNILFMKMQINSMLFITTELIYYLQEIVPTI